MILLIDNYDSFTWNLYQYFCELGAGWLSAVTTRSDWTISGCWLRRKSISPGPCTPSESGISLDVIQHYASKLPIRRLRPSGDC